MDDDALYYNFATVGASAADIEPQIKAYQSMSAVQGSKFNADDTLFVFGSGEAAVVSARPSHKCVGAHADGRNLWTAPRPRRAP